MVGFKQFISDLLTEVSYRSNEGIVDLNNPDHISILSEVLDEMGLSEIKDELFYNLFEAEGEPKSEEDKEYKGIGGQPTAYVKAGDYQKWQSNPDSFNGPKFKKTDSGKYVSIQAGEDGEGGESKSNIFQQNYDAPDIKKNKKDSESDIELASPKREISGKDKTLKKVDTLSAEEFGRDLEPNDDDFAKRNAKIANPIPPQPYQIPESLKQNTKFPKKYLTALERMMNTKPTGDGTKWTHYSDIPGGAGQISAQAGELMTMMGSTMSDSEFEEFTNSLLEHESELIKSNPKLKTEGSRIVTKSWINSAKNNREAILNRIRREYPNSEIVASAWDTKDDVESLGLSDYEKNKGFSTDMYLKIRTKDGNEILDEVSLKKSTEVNFLNSGAGKFFEWDDNLPDEINQNVYRDNQRKRLTESGEKFKSDVERLLSSGSESARELRKAFESKKIDFDQALEDTKNGKGSRAKSKVILEAIKALADEGNLSAKQYLEENDRIHRQFQQDAVKAITENPKMKEGMLNEIRSEFPLKAVSDGEESMAIGNNSLDRDVMREIFGTSNYDDIKEKLSAEPGPPPFLGYRAEIGSELIPLAEIRVREDGVGYGGQIKFEMQLDRRFAKILKQANQKVYNS